MQWTATGPTRPKPSMPPSRKHRNRIRDLVLQSAGRLFNRHGFNAVSIDEDRENLKPSGSERARTDKIVQDYLSEAEDSTADTSQ